MNDPKQYEFQCPNPSCQEGSRFRYISHPSVPFERLQYVQIDQFGREVASLVVYRCRRCGYEFSLDRVVG